MTDNNFNISYFDTCGSHTMVMLHGYPFNNGMWAPQFSDLYDLARMIAPDYPGHGSSDPLLDDGYTIELLAQQCFDLLDGLQITKPVILCGLSMGGYVALEMYRQAPERVKGLILASTRADADTAATKSIRESQVTQIRHGRLEEVNDEMIKKLFSPVTVQENSELVEYIREIMNQTTPEGAVGSLRAMKTRADSTDLLSEINVPTIVMHGEDDVLISVDTAAGMATAIPTAELHILPDAGHLPNLEQPDIFNDIVAGFLQEFTE